MSRLALSVEVGRPVGALAPYFEGLGKAEAHGTRCAQCSRTWFAPRLTCPCGATRLEWTRLAGTGSVVAVTETEVRLPGEAQSRPGCFAWIALDGASNRVLGFLEPGAVVVPGTRVRLVADPGPRAGHCWRAIFRPEG